MRQSPWQAEVKKPSRTLFDTAAPNAFYTRARQLSQEAVDAAMKSLSHSENYSRTYRSLYGLIVTITTPWLSTGAEYFPVNFPSSLCVHKSLTAAPR